MNKRNELVIPLIKNIKTKLECRSDVFGILLVGSYARKAEKNNSDVDVVIITSDEKYYYETDEWISELGEYLQTDKEKWWIVSTIKVHFSNIEVEFNFAGLEWLKTTKEKSTNWLLSDGYVVLYERNSIFEHIKREFTENSL